MRKSWWKKQADLDDAQKSVISLPKDGRYIISGPPGSGKTNLLLLRAMFLSGSGLKDVLFVTVGRTLQEFIVTGIGANGLIETDQILTFRKWTMRHLGQYSPRFMKAPPTGSYSETQALYATELERVNKELPQIYNAILVDEVQDLTGQELRALTYLSKRIMVAGDDRQQIYDGDGLRAAQGLGFTSIPLQYHYRIGRRICEAADSVLPPMSGAPALVQTCNYDENTLPSSRLLVEAINLDEQVAAALKEIRVQIRAYPGEAIGVLLPKKNLFSKVRAVLDASNVADKVSYHDPALGGERQFPEDKQIFVMTIHAAKGTEFRAVHILSAESLRGSLDRRRLVFTAFTRAKTSLRVYHTGAIPGYIKSAFAQPTTPELDKLFS